MAQAREETTATVGATSRWSALKERVLDVAAGVLVLLFLVGTTLLPRGLDADLGSTVDVLALRGAALVKDVVQGARGLTDAEAEVEPMAVPEASGRLEVEGPLTVVVRVGGPRVRVVGAASAVRVEDLDGVLRLERVGPGAVRVEVAAEGLRDVLASGGSTVELEGVEGDVLGLQAARGARVVARGLQVGTVQVLTSSGAQVQLAGDGTEQLLVHARSGSRVVANALEVDCLQVSAAGASSVQARASERVDARVASASNVTVRGSPEVRDVKVGTTSTLAWY